MCITAIQAALLAHENAALMALVKSNARSPAALEARHFGIASVEQGLELLVQQPRDAASSFHSAPGRFGNFFEYALIFVTHRGQSSSSTALPCPCPRPLKVLRSAQVRRRPKRLHPASPLPGPRRVSCACSSLQGMQRRKGEQAQEAKGASGPGTLLKAHGAV